MNFDFLKNLKGIGFVYNPCNDAEELVNTKPYLSMTAARKSAELLAKFIYLAAHSNKMEDMTFSDILRDREFRNFVHNRDVMDAFHFIRKSGNVAVHGDAGASSDDALDVLQDLHYVAGETACKLGYINDYPDFDDEIGSYPDADYHEVDKISDQAKQMFAEYVSEFQNQNRLDELEDSTLEYAIEGCVEIQEFISFEHKPKLASTIAYVQSYFLYLAEMAMERTKEKMPGIDYPVKLRAVLKINDNETYSSENMAVFTDAVRTKLPLADKFSISSYCEGNLRDYYSVEDENGDIIEANKVEIDSPWNGAGMLDKLESLKRRERFCYKQAVFYYNSGECSYEKIENGREYDVLSLVTPDILKHQPDGTWWSDSVTLGTYFEYEDYPEIIEKLHTCVKKHIPATEIRYCESAWEDDEEPCLLIPGIQWCTDDLNKIQEFLNELNNILEPIADDVSVTAEGTWEIKDEFSVATWDWLEDHFEIVGVNY